MNTFSVINNISSRKSRKTTPISNIDIIMEVIINGDNENNNGCFIICIFTFEILYIYMPKTYTMENKVNTQTAALSEIQTLGHGDPRRNKLRQDEI